MVRVLTVPCDAYNVMSDYVSISAVSVVCTVCICQLCVILTHAMGTPAFQGCIGTKLLGRQCQDA